MTPHKDKNSKEQDREAAERYFEKEVAFDGLEYAIKRPKTSPQNDYEKCFLAGCEHVRAQFKLTEEERHNVEAMKKHVANRIAEGYPEGGRVAYLLSVISRLTLAQESEGG